MNQAYLDGIELEKRMREVFEKVGWDCQVSASPGDAFDIALCKGEKTYGYVETYVCKNPQAMRRRVERITEFMNSVKPELFILTDGRSFETYIKGEYCFTTTIPIGYEEFQQSGRLMAYLKAFMEMRDGNKRN